MTQNEYLKKVLKNQDLVEDGPELAALRKRRKEVEKLLTKEFSQAKPKFRYGGSKAKGTMIRESYDFDLTCYFAHDSVEAGETLADVFDNVEAVLKKKYSVKPKTSALRLRSTNEEDFHVDVVPGRFVNDKKNDDSVFLYCSTGEKSRLKTNLGAHIEHVRSSGVSDAIRLTKLWKVRNGIQIKGFVLELLVIDILQSVKKKSISTQMKKLWETLRDEEKTLSVEDPANPQGNDLSDILSSKVRSELASAARRALKVIDKNGWEGFFGVLDDTEVEKKRAHVQLIRSVKEPVRPWCSQ